MLNKLTKQERVLIITLLTVIIWAAGIMLVIKPNIEKNSDMKTKLEVAEQAKIDVDVKIESEPTTKENIVKSRKALYTTLDPFFPATQNYDVDQYIMKLWTDNGLAIESVTIEDPEVATLDYYSYEKTELQYPLGDYAKTQRAGLPVNALADTEGEGEEKEEGTTDEKTDETATTNESCEITTVTVSVKGTQQQIRNFINSASNDPKTLLVTDVSAAGDPNGEWNAAVTISFIAVDKYEG